MIITSSHQLSSVLQFLNGADKISLDVETTGLNTRKDKVIGIGLSDGTQSFYICHLDWNTQDQQLEECVPKNAVASLLSELLSKKLTGWNLKYDIQIIGHYFGVDLAPAIWSDGMLAKHTVDEDFPFGLKEVAAREYGSDAKKEQEDLKASIRKNGGAATEYFKADLEVQARYCMQDCLLAYKLNEKFVAELERQRLTKFYFEDEVMPLYREVTINMERTGIHLDMQLLERTHAEMSRDIAALESRIHEAVKPYLGKFEEWYLNKEYPATTTGPFIQALCVVTGAPLPKLASGKYSLAGKYLNALPEDHIVRAFVEGRTALDKDLIHKARKIMHGDAPMLNLSSKHHLKKIFFEELKETPLSRTDLGNPQVDDEFLESVAQKYDFVPMLLDYNRLVKIKGAYIDRFMETQENGVWYPQFHQHRTVSGRFGSDAQQLSRKVKPRYEGDIVAKYNNVIRDLLVAGPNEVLIGADYMSLEPVVFAHASGDENLKNIFRQGHDFYSTIAIRTERLEGYSPDKRAPNYLGTLNPDLRQRAKAYCLGVPYGMTGYKLKFQLECPQEDAEQLVADYLSAFPALHEFMKRSKEVAKLYGTSRSEAGRVRHLKRARWIYAKHGDTLVDSLELWKKYHETPGLYKEMKELRSTYNNELNNSINFKIQSLAASIVNRACIAMTREFRLAGLLANVCLQIHDEVVVRCPQVQAEAVAAIMQRCMEQTYTLSVPLIAEPHIGTCYGDIK